MATLIFADSASYDEFEAKMAGRAGIPKPGRNAATGEIVDPDRKTGKGWTTQYSAPAAERAGPRVLARVKAGEALDADDAALIETRQAELDKFGRVKTAIA